MPVSVSDLASLRKKAATGFRWNVASQLAQQITSLATAVVLARLLLPSDFGLLAMATVVTGFVMLFRDFGTSMAVISHDSPSDELLSTVFWANVGFGGIATALIALSAPLVALYYHNPRVTPILRVLALTFVVSGIGLLHQALLERKLLFRLVAKIDLAGAVLGAIVGISAAIFGFGIWALVLQSLSTALLVTLLLWCLSDWRPRVLFRLPDLVSISSYSLNLAGFNIVNYFSRNADYLLIGRFLGASLLGVYTLAYRMMLYPLQTITGVVNRVMIPIYSQFRDDEQFRSFYLHMVGVIAFVTFPMMCGLWVLAEPTVLVVFGPKWSSAVPVIRILAPIGMIQSVTSTAGSSFLARKRTDLMFRTGVAFSSITVVAFAVGLRWGITGVATAYAVSVILISVPLVKFPFRLIGLPVSRFLISLVRPLLAATTMGAILFAATAIVPIRRFEMFAAVVTLGILVYLLASWCINRDGLREALRVIAGRHCEMETNPATGGPDPESLLGEDRSDKVSVAPSPKA